MEKNWLKRYQNGVPVTINPDQYPSLLEYIEQCFDKFSDKSCYTNMGKVLSYKEIDNLSKAFAGFLQNKCQLQKGDRVAIMMPNTLQYPVAMFGALRAGMTVVNINPLYTATELNHVLQDSGAKCIIVLANFANTLQKVVANSQVKHVVVTELGDLFSPVKKLLVNFVVKHIKKMVPKWDIPEAYSFSETVDPKNLNAYSKPSLVGEDIAYLQYTGGTTGGAKGAILTHRNMVANVLQATNWIAPFINQGLNGGIITALPLYHIFSLTANCLTFLGVGVPNILITNPRDIPGFVKELQRQPFAVMTGVNTLFNALLRNEQFRNLDFTNFKFTLGGGMAVQRAVAKEWRKVTSVILLEAYGLTEASPAVTINPLDLKEYNGSIGLPLPSTDIKICSEDGAEQKAGEPGELWVKGPQVMRGYWQQPDKTKEVLTDDGWLKTGDIAKVNDEGFVYIVDRKKDMILVSGFNVYPNEVEDVIKTIPGINEVAVIGVNAGVRGEVVKAFVVRDDDSITEEKILAHCREHLTAYKIPKEFEFREELPKTNVGKVLRRALREDD